jgi:hypothetical protein
MKYETTMVLVGMDAEEALTQIAALGADGWEVKASVHQYVLLQRPAQPKPRKRAAK